MVSLRGEDYMKDIRKTSHEIYKTGISDKRVICVKFRRERTSESYTWFRRGSRDTGVGDEQRRNNGVGTEDDEANPGEDGDTIVFVLHMLDDHGALRSRKAEPH